VSGRFRVVPYATWADLRAAAPARRPDVLIVDLYHPKGPGSVSVLLETTKALACGLVVCSDFTGRESDLLVLGLEGVSSVLMVTQLGTRPQIALTIERAIAQAIAKDIVGPLEGKAPELALRTLEWAVGNASAGADAEGLARSLEVSSPKALANQLRQEGLPPVRRTLLWGRLIYAARQLERGADSVEAIAHRLGYASRSGLTKAISDTLGTPPTQLLCIGGSGSVVKAYLQEVGAT